MTDLLPCPFCGSTNLRHEFAGSQGFIECNECGTAGPCDERAADPICDYDAAYAAWNRRAAALLERLSAAALAVVPVPVSERLPGDELCWWYEPDEDDDGSGYGGNWTLLRIRGGVSCYTHWLPAHALPLPAGEGEP